MVVTQASDLDTQHLGSRSRMGHGCEDGLSLLPQDALLVSPERWIGSSEASRHAVTPMSMPSATLGSPSVSGGCLERGVVRVRHAVCCQARGTRRHSEALSQRRGITSVRVARRPSAASSSAVRSTVSSRLRDRRERRVMGDRVRMRGWEVWKAYGRGGPSCA